MAGNRRQGLQSSPEKSQMQCFNTMKCWVIRFKPKKDKTERQQPDFFSLQLI